MYVVASDNKQISLLSSFFACTRYAEDKLEKPLKNIATF